jgi:nitroreductase
MLDQTQNPRVADHPVDAMFLNRHSARAFTEKAIEPVEVMSLLEAARWAPSANNNQPARFAYGLRGTPAFERIAATLAPGNLAWAGQAAALIVVGAKTTVTRDGEERPNPTHGFDAGAAWMSLALQAHLTGWVAHAMGGFDKDKAAADLGLGAGHVLYAVVAVGQKAALDSLPEAARAREIPNGRVPLAVLAAEGQFPQG